jgi:hypothetical protein
MKTKAMGQMKGRGFLGEMNPMHLMQMDEEKIKFSEGNKSNQPETDQLKVY